MITKPAILENAWWKQPAWLKYGAKLFRFYSLKRNYRLRYNPAIATAAVSHEKRTAWLNPLWPEVPAKPVRCLVQGRDFHLAMLKGFLAHEAGHVRFSTGKPKGLLGDVWNCLEDERIERLMTKDHSELTDVFTLMGDLFAARAVFTGDALEGCLYWRWCFDQEQPLWRSGDPAWESIRPLVERAWEAATSDEVIDLAREILARLGLPEDAPEDPRFEQLSAAGAAPGQDDGQLDDGVGSGAGGEPSPPAGLPDPQSDRAARILLDIEGYARDLAAALKPPAYSKLRRSHRTRGRFTYDRFLASSDRVYRLKSVERERPMEVRVCLDLSGSMGRQENAGSRLHTAVRACALLLRACALANVPIGIYGFHTETVVVCERTTPHDEAILNLARVEGYGGTLLNPTLEHALSGARPGTIVMVICDGQLLDDDAERCRERLRRARDAGVLPILVGDASSAPETFEAIFGRYLAVHQLADLPGRVRAWFLARS
jgi:Mg-chelatase subunit ChlD